MTGFAVTLNPVLCREAAVGGLVPLPPASRPPTSARWAAAGAKNRLCGRLLASFPWSISSGDVGVEPTPQEHGVACPRGSRPKYAASGGGAAMRVVQILPNRSKKNPKRHAASTATGLNLPTV